jgi:YidC/Oxa1 family membrane protein insertase
MSATMFFTQRQLTMKNMPKAALEGPMANTQKIMLYALPVIFLISGVNFPVGVLIYWTTSNLWTMGQQFYTIRRMPAPGSEAERLLNERKAAKAAKKGVVVEEPTEIEPPKPVGQRQQPVRKNRKKKK